MQLTLCPCLKEKCKSFAMCICLMTTHDATHFLARALALARPWQIENEIVPYLFYTQNALGREHLLRIWLFLAVNLKGTACFCFCFCCEKKKPFSYIDIFFLIAQMHSHTHNADNEFEVEFQFKKNYSNAIEGEDEVAERKLFTQ